MSRLGVRHVTEAIVVVAIAALYFGTFLHCIGEP